MIIIHDHKRIVALADSYDGADPSMTAPDDFDPAMFDQYRIEGGQLVAPAKPTDDEIRAQALSTIDAFHAQTVMRMVGSPTQVEKDTWAMKLETASAIASGKTISPVGKAFLAAAGISTTEAKADWSKTVLGKSAGYATVVGVAEKLRNSAREAVKAATDADAIGAALQAAVVQSEAAIAQLTAG